MTAVRGAAVGALLVAIVVVAVLLLSMGGTHSYKMVFQNAGQLVNGDDVQVGGRRVGSVNDIELTKDNQAEITVSIEDGFAPLHEGSKAVIRATSLSGIANRYIALTPGPNNMPKLDDDATIGTDNTTSIVDLDQLFNTLDARTRRGLQQLFHGSAVQFQGKHNQKLAGEAAHLFSPALSTTARLVNEVGRDQGVLTNTLVQTSRTVTTLAGRKNDLTNLITNANITTGAIAAENDAFARDLREIPPTLRQANSTFVDLRTTLDALDPLVDASKPATKRLAPFLRVLRPLVAKARPTLHDLRVAITSPGPNNDLIDTTRLLPGFERETRVVFPRTVQTLKRSQGTLDFVRPYVPELVGWFKDFGQGASWYDANGHYAHIQPIFNTFQLSEGNTLVPKAVRNPLGGYLSLGTGAGQLRRCPGAAAAPRPDGGNPFVDTGKFSNADCKKSEVLPAP